MIDTNGFTNKESESKKKKKTCSCRIGEPAKLSWKTKKKRYLQHGLGGDREHTVRGGSAAARPWKCPQRPEESLLFQVRGRGLNPSLARIAFFQRKKMGRLLQAVAASRCHGPALERCGGFTQSQRVCSKKKT